MSSLGDFTKMTVGEPCTVCIIEEVENPGMVYVEFSPIRPLVVKCENDPKHFRTATESEAHDFWARNAEIRG